MAFTTTFTSTKNPGETSNAYNVDFSVGAGARGNLPEDIMLVQALLRIVHFETEGLAPPPQDRSIAVDGMLGPATLRFILNFQRQMQGGGFSVRLDGIFDPFRHQGEMSHLSQTQYALEVLNHTAFSLCRKNGMSGYEELPRRDDIPEELRAALNQPQRELARMYEGELVA
jgi:hypothetical protein